MIKKLSICLIITLIFVFSLGSISFAGDSNPVSSPLKLTVQQSLLTIYPPIMIYTAQLNTAIPAGSTVTVEFYHVIPGPTPTSPTQLQYLGSAPLDKTTKKAVLNRTMTAGSYTAISKVVINTSTIYSNTVDYKVN